MNCTIGQILPAYFLDEHQDHWPDYVAVTKMAINSIINASITQAPFEVLYGIKIPLPVDSLLSRESSINSHAHTFGRKMQQLVTKVKSSMHDA